MYSLFMAAIIKTGGTLKTVADAQAIVGILTTLLTVAFIRIRITVKCIYPLAVCALFYVFYGMPLELERLIRNETCLVFFATLAFGSWWCGLRDGSWAWIAICGLSAGLMHLLKGIFPVFPVIVIGLLGWSLRKDPRRFALLAVTFLLLFFLPTVSSKLYSRISKTQRPAEPEDGQMFLGRTAQWVYLEPGGVLPDIKARIRDQVQAYAERYRRTGKLDNNEIVKRTVVPTLKTIIVDERGGTLVDVNRVSWQIGLEAAAHHPFAYLRQFIHDLYYLNFISAQRMTFFEPKQLQDASRDAAIYADAKGREDPLTERIFELKASQTALHRAENQHSAIQRLARFLHAFGRLRLLSPVFLTTAALPLLVYATSGRERLFWLGNLLLWFYYLALLSTVGRPLDRYLMPVVPIMFWAITTSACLAWQRWCLPPDPPPAAAQRA